MAAHVAPVISGVALALALSPVLAGWADTLANRQRENWWRPRRVPLLRWAPVAGLAAALAIVAGLGSPWPTWWLFAAGGAVLAVVDFRSHLLPARLVYPLAGAELLTLMAIALHGGGSGRLLHAIVAAAVVGAAWLAGALAAPRGLGLGDARVAALGAGLLGWHGWQQVIDGQLAVWLVALPVALATYLANPATHGRRMQVPLGAALVIGPLLVAMQ